MGRVTLAILPLINHAFKRTGENLCENMIKNVEEIRVEEGTLRGGDMAPEVARRLVEYYKFPLKCVKNDERRFISVLRLQCKAIYYIHHMKESHGEEINPDVHHYLQQHPLKGNFRVACDRLNSECRKQQEEEKEIAVPADTTSSLQETSKQDKNVGRRNCAVDRQSGKSDSALEGVQLDTSVRRKFRRIISYDDYQARMRKRRKNTTKNVSRVIGASSSQAAARPNLGEDEHLSSDSGGRKAARETAHRHQRLTGTRPAHPAVPAVEGEVIVISCESDGEVLADAEENSNAMEQDADALVNQPELAARSASPRSSHARSEDDSFTWSVDESAAEEVYVPYVPDLPKMPALSPNTAQAQPEVLVEAGAQEDDQDPTVLSCNLGRLTASVNKVEMQVLQCIAKDLTSDELSNGYSKADLLMSELNYWKREIGKVASQNPMSKQQPHKFVIAMMQTQIEQLNTDLDSRCLNARRIQFVFEELDDLKEKETKFCDDIARLPDEPRLQTRLREELYTSCHSLLQLVPVLQIHAQKVALDISRLQSFEVEVKELYLTFAGKICKLNKARLDHPSKKLSLHESATIMNSVLQYV